MASVGITEDEAKKQGLQIKTGKFSFMANSRARAVEDADGLVKMIADKNTDKVIQLRLSLLALSVVHIDLNSCPIPLSCSECTSWVPTLAR